MQRAMVGLIVLATLTVPIQSVAQTPPPVPIMPPSLPAAHVVNLMTNEGSGAFGVQSSSASRFTAGEVVFLLLIQCGERPER